MSTYKILDKIESYRDVSSLSADSLSALADELRDFLINNVTQTGGHLASNLGIVEITLAILRTLDLPSDRVIFDVGHQSYVYKILTDRKARFSTLRSAGGISGFEKMSESPFDSYGTGHSSTALSAALGFAEADRMLGRDNVTVAVVGDGAFTGGLVHEALNNISDDLRLIMILNENEMSISRTTGGFARTLSRLRASRGYYSVKRRARDLISSLPVVGKGAFRFLKNAKQQIKNSVYGSNYFEDLGLYYLGPADGNDTEQVETLLTEAISCRKPAVIHLKTKKGLGYAPAEKHPGLYHSVLPHERKPSYSFSEKMGDILCSMAREDNRICAITAAMTAGCGLSRFKRDFCKRFFDVGIAEGHALVFASGLAAGGMRPFVPIYSSFLQRAYDSILHDAALQHLPVTVMVDRASLAEKDGATHHGIYDVSFVSGIPDTEIYAPSDFEALERFMRASLRAECPVFIRYPHSVAFSHPSRLYINEGTMRASHETDFSADAFIITYGRIISEAIDASNKLADLGISCKILLLERLKPLDTKTILSHLKGRGPIVFLEEGIRSGGVGENLYEQIREDEGMIGRHFKILAIDSFADRNDALPYYEFCKISSGFAVSAILGYLKKG